jgi:hypothetical protein
VAKNASAGGRESCIPKPENKSYTGYDCIRSLLDSVLVSDQECPGRKSPVTSGLKTAVTCFRFGRIDLDGVAFSISEALPNPSKSCYRLFAHDSEAHRSQVASSMINFFVRHF